MVGIIRIRHCLNDPPEKYDGHIGYSVAPSEKGCTVTLVRKAAGKTIVHTPDEYDFPDKLYQDCRENAESYGIVSERRHRTA